MSHSYEMHIQVSEFDPAKGPAIQQACFKIWPTFEETFELTGDTQDRTWFEATAPGYIYAGQYTSDVAEELRDAVWKAAGEYCLIRIVATDLENAPFDSFDYDETDYDELLVL